MRRRNGRHDRHGRWSSACVPVALVATLAVVTAGCTDGGNAAKGATTSGQRSSASGPASATVNASGKPVAVVDGGTPGAVSLGVSRALFTSAPVVVVAGAGDRQGLRDGAAQAKRLGVPLLLLDGAASPTGDTTTGTTSPATATPGATAATAPSATATPGASAGTPSAGSSTEPVPKALAAEFARLRAGTVLAIGTTVAARLGQLPGVRVVTDASALPAVTPPPSTGGASDLAVLVRTGGHAAAATVAAAASATASAAGARVVPVSGKDLRGDPDAIVALAGQHPSRVLAVGTGFGPVDRLAGRLSVAETGVQLPSGGQVLFPGHRLVALYGHPGTPALGVLGEQGLTASIARAKKIAAPYDALSKVPVVPTFEIIATTAQGAPGPDGDYSGESSVASLRPWVQKASAAGMYVVLDLQPGRADFLDQAKLYADLLALPNVGLALDPEWRLTPDQRPLEQIGGVDVEEINSVITWLAHLTAKKKLPQKLVVLHQFRLSMIRDEQRLDLGHDEIQVLIHMDGQGAPSLKDGTWATVTAAAPKGMPFGWKNFYDEDKPMLSPAATMAKKPTPMMISYQ